MPLTIEQGKMRLEAMLRKLAKENGIALGSVRWRETIASSFYYLEATNGSGKVAESRFSPEHLAGSELNISVKVVSKIYSMLIKLKGF